MSDNDLISRSHFDDRIRLAAGPDADLEYSADFLDGIKVVLYMLSTEPAVPQEMSAREFFEEYQRMCHTVDGCSDCPIMGIDKCAGFPCRYRAYLDPDKVVAVVEAWAKEHPEERSE